MTPTCLNYRYEYSVLVDADTLDQPSTALDEIFGPDRLIFGHTDGSATVLHNSTSAQKRAAMMRFSDASRQMSAQLDHLQSTFSKTPGHTLRNAWQRIKAVLS